MSVMGQDGHVTPEGTGAQTQGSADGAADAGGDRSPLIAPEVLVRFWPDLFGIGLHQRLGELVPGRAAHVNATDLATHLLAVPLFTLVRDGAAEMEAVDRKLLGLLPRRHLNIRPTGDGAAATTVGAALLAASGKGSDARWVVYRWFADDKPDPAHHVVRVTDQVAHQQGFYSAEQPPPHRAGLVGRKVASALVYHPIPERIAECRGPAERLAAQWREFGQHDPQVRDRLLAHVRAGIRSRKESDDDSDDGFDFGSND